MGRAGRGRLCAGGVRSKQKVPSPCARARAASPIRYSIVRSTAPRFPSTNTSSTPFGVYTLDAGTKKTLQSVARGNDGKGCADMPVQPAAMAPHPVHPNMRHMLNPHVRRHPRMQCACLEHPTTRSATHSHATLNAVCLLAALPPADNRRFYAASFQSQTVRFPEPKAPLATDAIYDVSKCVSRAPAHHSHAPPPPFLPRGSHPAQHALRVMNSQPATTEEALGSSPVHYAILRSKYKRFNDKPYGEVRGCVHTLVGRAASQSLMQMMGHHVDAVCGAPAHLGRLAWCCPRVVSAGPGRPLQC